jgi:hypothetical protein
VCHMPVSLDSTPGGPTHQHHPLPVVYFDDPGEAVVACLPQVRVMMTFHAGTQRHSVWVMRSAREVDGGVVPTGPGRGGRPHAAVSRGARSQGRGVAYVHVAGVLFASFASFVCLVCLVCLLWLCATRGPRAPRLPLPASCHPAAWRPPCPAPYRPSPRPTCCPRPLLMAAGPQQRRVQGPCCGPSCCWTGFGATASGAWGRPWRRPPSWWPPGRSCPPPRTPWTLPTHTCCCVSCLPWAAVVAVAGAVLPRPLAQVAAGAGSAGVPTPCPSCTCTTS